MKKERNDVSEEEAGSARDDATDYFDAHLIAETKKPH